MAWDAVGQTRCSRAQRDPVACGGAAQYKWLRLTLAQGVEEVQASVPLPDRDGLAARAAATAAAHPIIQGAHPAPIVSSTMRASVKARYSCEQPPCVPASHGNGSHQCARPAIMVMAASNGNGIAPIAMAGGAAGCWFLPACCLATHTAPGLHAVSSSSQPARGAGRGNGPPIQAPAPGSQRILLTLPYINCDAASQILLDQPATAVAAVGRRSLEQYSSFPQ